jgi:uncharacterized membrane protein HdeD (DUF308 family)
MRSSWQSPTSGPIFEPLSEAREHWLWFLALGIILVLLGTAAMFFPFVATLAGELMFGWILLFSGISQSIFALRLRHQPDSWLAVLSGLLTFGVGLILLLAPVTGILSLTLLLAVFFLANGMFRIVQALQRRPAAGWGWSLAGGALSLLLGLMVLAQWPSASAWLLGLLIGIDLMFTGWTLLWLPVAANRR